jgi:predicted AAA+ superfamily ATPase
MTLRHSTDYGPLLENMVFMHLRRKGREIEYIQTKDGYETDFFSRDKINGKIQLIQVCWDLSDSQTFHRELRGLKSAMAQFDINTGTIVTWDDETTIDDSIDVIPIWKWLLS